MKLGLSQACYRWHFYSWLRRDRPEYLYSGRPLPYFSQVPLVIEEGEAFEWLIDRCRFLGLSGLYASSTLIRDEAHARALRDRLRDRGVELLGGQSFDWLAQGEAAQRQRDLFQRGLLLAREAGARILCTTHAASSALNRFTREPPLARQLELITANFQWVAELAGELGMVVAMENHLDYRCSELVRVVEAVGSPHLRMNFDTANPVGVIEDPLDAARVAAPYTVMGHLKDFHIQPITQIGTPAVHWAPIGRGVIDLVGILEELQRRAPDPAALTMCLEVAPPPEHDGDLWIRDSILWIHAHLGGYFSWREDLDLERIRRG